MISTEVVDALRKFPPPGSESALTRCPIWFENRNRAIMRLRYSSMGVTFMALVFVSYSHRDQTFVTQLVADLHKNNVPVWFDKESILAGQRWDDAIEKGLTDSTHLIFVLSPDSVASQNVKDEVDTAIDANKAIVPVLLQDVKLPLRLRRIQYTDVTAQMAAVQAATAGPSLDTATPAQAAAIIGTQVNEIASSYATAQAAITLIEAQASPTEEWRPVAYDEATDGTLADLASDSADNMIALNAALAVAELRSTYAVSRLADKAYKGQPRALDALASIREEVPEFPPGIDPSIKRRAFWHMTWQQIFEHPLRLVARANGASIGYGLGLGIIIYIGFVKGVTEPSIVKGGINAGIGFGIPYGLLMGLAILTASELSARLVSWTLPGRLAAAWGIGTLFTALAFVPLQLQYETLDPVTLLISSFVFIAGFAVTPTLTRNTILRAIGGAIGIFAAAYGSWQFFPGHALIDLEGQLLQPLLLSVWLGAIVSVCAYVPEAFGYIMERIRRQQALKSS